MQQRKNNTGTNMIFKDIFRILLATIKVYKELKKQGKINEIAKILKRQNDEETNKFINDIINNNHGIL